jgi:hypothetical protein
VRIQRRGGRIIPHEVDAEHGHPSYLVPVPGTGTWTHRLCSLVPGMRPRPPAAADRAAWLRSLVERGVLDAHCTRQTSGTRAPRPSRWRRPGSSTKSAHWSSR